MDNLKRLRRIDFSGHNSHEPVSPGTHLTLRHGAKYRSLVIGDKLMLVDLENLNRGFGSITNIAHDVTLASLRSLGEQEFVYERSHLNTSKRVMAALCEYYPNIDDETQLTAIEYSVHVSEVL